MRSWARGVCLLLASAWFGGLPGSCFICDATAGDFDRLEVHTDPDGGVRATARIVFPAPVSIIQAILTDYATWPALFETKMRLAGLSIDHGVATTDLRISHVLLPGERQLVSESRTLADGGLVTDLKGGDFKRYHRVWKLLPADNGRQTSADFELIVEINTLLPDWLVAMAVHQELAAHFRIVKEKAVTLAARGK
jgi:hypothetical protein